MGVCQVGVLTAESIVCTDNDGEVHSNRDCAIILHTVASEFSEPPLRSRVGVDYVGLEVLLASAPLH
jgi:hypothetical protein